MRIFPLLNRLIPLFSVNELLDMEGNMLFLTVNSSMTSPSIVHLRGLKPFLGIIYDGTTNSILIKSLHSRKCPNLYYSTS
jgi:hypothetical protein